MPVKGSTTPRQTITRRSQVLARAAACTLLGVITTPARAAEVTSTFRATGNWSDSTRWTNSPTANTFPNDGNLGHTFSAVLNVSTLQVARLDVNAAISNLTLTNGSLQPGTTSAYRFLTVNNTFTFGVGYLGVPVTIPAGGRLQFVSPNFTGSPDKQINNVVTIAGEVTFAPGPGDFGIGTAYGGTARVILETGARFAVPGSAVFYAPPSSDGPGYAFARIDNAGAIEVAPTGNLRVLPGWSLTNTGSVIVDGRFTVDAFKSTGLLDLRSPGAEATVLGGGTISGGVRLAAGSHLIFRSGQYGRRVIIAGPSITNAGTITFDGSVTVTAPTTIPGYVDFGSNTAVLGIAADTTFTGPFYISSTAPSSAPLIDVRANATFAGPTTLNAWIGGTGRATASNLTFASGRIGVKEFVVPAGGKLSLPATAASRELSATTLRIHGTAEWAGGTLTASSTNRIEIAPGGVLRITPGAAAVLSPTNTTASPVNSLVNAGLLHVDHATLATAWRTTNSGTIHIDSGSLTLPNLANNTGTIRVTAGALRLLSLPATTTGSIDLHDGGVALFGNNASTLAAVRAQIRSGRNQGRWDGPGIHSSLAQADPAAAVGYLKITNAGIGTWRGFPVYNGEVVAASTLLGDATLDGAVDFNDLVKLAQHYNAPATKDWFEGDFTYDGKVDFNDLVKLAQNYNTTLPAPAAIPGAPADFGADLARAFATVPEPAATPLLALAAACFTARRRRNRPRKIPL